MLDLILAGGWVMCPLIICSILALAIITERLWCLRTNKIVPAGLSASVLDDLKNKSMNVAKLTAVEQSSALGELLSLIIRNIKHDRATMVTLINEAGRGIIHKLEKNLNFLGTLASISPLLGLFGTVVGIIDVFSNIMQYGGGDATKLAGGISVALITTAAGLCVAIPCLAFHRGFERKLDELSYMLESEALKFLDAVNKINKNFSVASTSHTRTNHDVAEREVEQMELEDY